MGSGQGFVSLKFNSMFNIEQLCEPHSSWLEVFYLPTRDKRGTMFISVWLSGSAL